MKKIAFAAAAAVAFALSANTLAGPVVIGGDDLNDHGFWDGSANVSGWLYIQNALASLIPQVTLSGNDGTIVVLGSDPAGLTATSSDGCGAVSFPAQALVPPRTVNCIDGDVAIAAYLADVASGTEKPAVIVYPGNGVSNGIDAAEEAAWAAGATTIADYVAAGGGLLAHEGGFTWLTALLPGIVVEPSCLANPGATLTTAGSTAFPTLSDADINAGPCHASFSGDFGGLQVLANDGSVPPLPFILGGGSGTTFSGTPMSIPALNPWMLALLAALLGLMALHGLVRRRPDSN